MKFYLYLGEGVLPEKLRLVWGVGVCGPLTKICDFLHPIYELTKNSITYRWLLRMAQFP